MSKPRNRLTQIVREPVTVAIFTAILVAGVLAFAVIAIWTGAPGSGGPNADLAVELAAKTPTPRTINWPGSSPTKSPETPSTRPPRAPSVANVPAINPVPTEVAVVIAASPSTQVIPEVAPQPMVAPTATEDPPVEATLEATVEPTATAVPMPTESPPPSPTPEPDFEAADAASFAPLVAGRWTVANNQLINDSPQALSEPWLQLPYQTETGDFAIEAEIRVDGLAPGVCNQTFGVIAGSQAIGQHWGGGILYPCGLSSSTVRLTDVSNWTDGYDQDRELGREDFAPGQEWHQYRLEVRGNELTLLIDGKEVLTATESALPAGLTSGQVGLWTQGVRLSVRRVIIASL